MKIGLYGGLANNCYVFANILNKYGEKVLFIRDRNDAFAFSQPVWEDSSFVMNYEDIVKSSNFSTQDWKKIEIDQKWKTPIWYEDPLISKIKSPIVSRDLSYINFISHKYLNQSKYRSRVVSNMQNCDVLLVCGIEGSILAMLSSRPYIIWPHGGDIRMAAGLTKPPQGFRNRISFEVQKLLLNIAYDKANYVGTHDPKGLGGTAGSVEKALHKTHLIYLPIPIECKRRLSKRKRRSRLNELCLKLNLPNINADFIGIVPSRVDFEWKGHDLILNAIKNLNDKQKIHLVFSGWGNDYSQAKQMVDQYEINDFITFLPFSLSKPLLTEFFSLMDFSIDQFRFLGTYGTALVEALSSGCPAITWIEEEAYISMGWSPPPVMNAKSIQDLIKILNSIVNKEIDLENFSKKSINWIKETHSPNKVLPNLIKKFKNIRSKSIKL